MSTAPKLKLGTPGAGWLPVRLDVGDQSLEFAASDVLSNPIEDLCSSLLDIAAGRASNADWFLEPGSYVFALAASGMNVTLEVVLVERWTSEGREMPEQRTSMLSWSGSTEEIVTSFWRSLKQFQHADITKEQWSWPFPNELLQKVEELALRQRLEG
jgi:hypothetical protein